MSEPPRITLELEGGVLSLGLNRPGRHNIYDIAMRDALFDALGVAATHPDVRAVVVFGEGENYSAGADLGEFGTAPSAVTARRVRFARDVWGRVLDCPHPVVAALHGYCLGSGLELALLCDMRVAAADAVLGLPEIALGMIPAAGGTQSAPRVAGAARASGLLLTGDRVDAATALRLRLVDEVVPAGTARQRATTHALRLVAMPQGAVHATREALHRGADLPLHLGLDLEARLAGPSWHRARLS